MLMRVQSQSLDFRDRDSMREKQIRSFQLKLARALFVICCSTLGGCGGTADRQSVEPVIPQGPTATVNWTDVHQTMQGFGAYNAFAGTAVNPYDTLLFSTLGYSLLRASLPLDDSCDFISNLCAIGDSNIADMRSCVANGCKVWATVSSPPADMKTNGNVECTCRWCDADSWRLRGIRYLYVELHCEFEDLLQYSSLRGLSTERTGYMLFWNCSRKRSLRCRTANLDTFIGSNLGPTLAANGQSSTLIMMPETGSYSDLSIYADTCMGDSSCSSYVGITAFHDYDNASSPTNPYSTSQFWETEVSAPDGPSLCNGCWDPSIADALMWAGIVHTNLVNGVTAWHYFWYVDPTGANENSGLINPAMSTPISIRTYAIAQWAKFVRPGWVRIDATANPVSGVDVTAFKNPSTGQFAIVAINENTSSSAVNFPFSGSRLRQLHLT